MKKRFPNEDYDIGYEQLIIEKFVKRSFIVLSIVVAVSTFVVFMNSAAAINESKTQFQTGEK